MGYVHALGHVCLLLNVLNHLIHLGDVCVGDVRIYGLVASPDVLKVTHVSTKDHKEGREIRDWDPRQVIKQPARAFRNLIFFLLVEVCEEAEVKKSGAVSPLVI